MKIIDYYFKFNFGFVLNTIKLLFVSTYFFGLEHKLNISYIILDIYNKIIILE